jgi:hypothetical protein
VIFVTLLTLSLKVVSLPLKTTTHANSHRGALPT